MTLTMEKVEAIQKKLREMPPAPKKEKKPSKAEAVKVLSKEIAVMQKRGYTLEQIAEILNGDGLEIATPTLKSYVQRARQKQKKSTKGRTKKVAKVTSENNNSHENSHEPSKAHFDITSDTKNI